MNNDYIIAVDETGQPFIAHASGIGSWKNKAVKYIKKIKDGAKTRYFYTQKELDAYYAEKHGEKQSKPKTRNKNTRGRGLGANSEWVTIDENGFSGHSSKIDANDTNLQLVTSQAKKPSYAEVDSISQKFNSPQGHRKNISGQPKEGWSKLRKLDEEDNLTAFGENRSQKALINAAEDFSEYLKESVDYISDVRSELDDARSGMHFAKKLYDDAVKNHKKNPSAKNEQYMYEMEENYTDAKYNYADWVYEYDWAMKDYRNDLKLFKDLANNYQKAVETTQKRGIRNWGMRWDDNKEEYRPYDYNKHSWIT